MAIKSSCVVIFGYSMKCLILVSITEDCFSMNLSQLPPVKKTLNFFISALISQGVIEEESFSFLLF